jgi:uncharacterized repeat protein (TIGR01451 family)
MKKILPCSSPFPAKALFRVAILRACVALLLGVSALPAGAVDLLVSNFTDAPDPAVRGGTLVYSATITNNAADTAHNVALVFDLDPDTTFVSVSDSTNCSYAAGQVTCSYATVNGDISGPNTADVITVNVTAQSKTTAGSTVNASATVSTSDTDTVSGNNTLSQLTTIDDGADLALTLTPSPTSVVASGTVSYTAATVNNGPNVTGTVTVTTTLSPNITYQSASGSGWSCGVSGQVVTCTRASAAVGALPDITIAGKETGAVTGTVTTTGVVAISGSATDYNNANDASTANITVTTGTDLAITKTASSGTPSSGLPMTFTLLPRNLGPFSASSVTVTDTLPAGFTGISASGTGWACGVAGQTVTCTAASYAVGATNNITVSTTAPTVLSSTNFTNTAQISSTTPDPISSNDTGSVSVNVLPDGVDLSITKTKTPDPVAQGSNLTSAIKVKNNGPQNARTGEITVADTLPAGESYVSYSGSNWTCGAVGQVVTCTYNAALNNGSTASTLTLTTTAVNAGTLTNNACASYTDSVGSLSDPVSGNNCASATVQSTVSSASIDLMIAKTVDQDPLVWNASPLTYTLTVTNAGPGDATGVVVTDAIPGYKSGATGITVTSTGGTASATFNCTTGSTVTCTQNGGTIAAGSTKVFTIAVARPMYDSSSQGGGKFTNTATVTSTDQGDTDLSNNSASVQVKVDPVVDVTMQNSVTPTSAQAGTNATYVLTVNNNGPSTAKSVTVSDVFTVSAGTMTFISATPSTGTCASFDTGTNTLSCSLGDMTEGATATVTIVVRPDYMSSPPNPRTIDNTATVSTTTQDSNTANNAASSTLTVTQASLDLLVNNTDSPDPLGFVPASASPVFPDNVVTYHNVITNRGPSVASNLVLTYTMTPPSGKAMTFLGDKLTSSGQSYSNYCNNLNVQATSASPLTITCTFPANFILAASNATTDLYLDFRVDTNPAPTGDSFASTVSITSNEPESLSANNSASQTTTVRMRSDLQLAKSARAYLGGADAATSTVQVRQPFYWVLTLTNAGPGDSQVTQITDTLPAGVVLYTGGTVAPYNAAPYNGGVTWSTNNGTPTSGTCTGTTTLTCSIGLLESGKVATVLVPVVSASNGTRNNCASATTSEVDPNSANNTTICNSVTVQKSSIAGTVYSDLNNNGAKGTGEAGISGVTVTLNGTDLYGNAVTNVNKTTDASGNFKFDTLSPGTYALSETQPSSYLDGIDAAGTSGGSASGAGADAISSVTLAENTAATGYLFGELAPATISGYAFIDANSNAVRDAGDTAGVSGITITLTGTDDLGAVSTTATTGANGSYSFANLRPGTYQVQEATVAGLTHTGMTVGSKGGQDGATPVSANTAVTGATKRTIGSIPVVAADTAQNYNFGESGQGLTGFVYADLNNNGIKDAGEPGIQGVSVTLSGTTSGNADVCAVISPNPCTVTSGADGSYGFSGIPGSNGSGYTLTEQSQATAPLSGYGDGAESVGTLGGSASTNDVFSGIVINVGQFGANYNFGEKGGSLVGTVYHDKNDNGAQDGGEPGIAGVTVTLSGLTASGANVCSVVAGCTATTAADGSFTFSGLPASNGTGYTITETQPGAYGERTNTAGTSGGSSSVVGGNSVISGVVLTAGTAATGYLFGEKSGTVSGFVYVDVNNNGVKDGGETGVAGVSLQLSGTDVLGTAVSLTTTTNASGAYSFVNLLTPNGTGYSVTETQPTGYIDGQTTIAGGNSGTAGSTKPVASGATDVISGIALTAGASIANYNFGELPIGTVSGTVFADENDNGLKDGDDYGISGVVLHLTGTDIKGSTINLTTTTAADGSYSFTNLLQSTGAGYTIHEVQPAAYTDGKDTIGGGNPGSATSVKPVAAGSDDLIINVALAPAGNLTGYNFAEKTSGNSISGFVYVDANDNGLKDGGETGIADVKVVLTGTSDTGATISRTVTSAVDGSFTFINLPPSNTAGYSITETQPPSYTDGKTTITGGAPGTASTAKPVGVGNIDVISGVKLVFGHDLNGYLFGEKGIPFLKPPIVNGYVWLDRDHSRTRPVDGSQQGAPGWTVQLKQNGTLICTTNTDSAGFYQFDNLHCPGYEASGLPTGTGFSISFSKDGTNLPAVPISGGNKGTVPSTGGQITNITLNPSDAIVEQNLPLDPAGVVYDALTRQPVSGATVTITGPAGFDPATHLVGGTAAQSQVVGSDGLYQFLLQNAFPSGVYTLSVTAPSGYQAAPSSILPACAGVATVGLVPTPALVQASNTAPAVSVPQPASPAACVNIVAGGAPTTQYYFSFNITNGGSAPILNNHIPLDPVSAGAILVTKTTPMVNVARGDLVPYTITATNTLPGTLAPVTLRDQMPPGFKYRSGSGTANGAATEPTVSGRTLSWSGQSFAPKEKKTYTLVLVVGAGVGDGDYVNQAFALGGVTNTTISNLATATVRVVPDPTFDCPDVIGKVFDDKNANGYQDQGEIGIPNVRLATPRGLLVTTDAEGRFHVPCPDIPNADRGSNFVMKLDDRTLPSGYRLTTENPRDVRITRGKLVKLNFGATIHRVVRIELADAAFETGKAVLRPEWNKQIDTMIEQLKVKPSVVRIAYKRTAEAAALAAQRIAVLRDEIERRWHALDGMYPLVVETEDAQ